MELTADQKERIARFVPAFRRYLDDSEHNEDMLKRQARRDLYVDLLSPDALRQMTILEFGQVISSLWASRMWGDKGYLVDKLIFENGLPTLVEQLRRLLWGKGDLTTRYDTFRKAVRGLGTASITEILAFVHPEQCGLWNDIIRHALGLLGFTVPRKSQISGQEYEQINAIIAATRDELEQEHDIVGLDYLGMDYFFFAVWETGRELSPEARAAGMPALDESEGEPTPPEDFDHSEIVEHLVNIGQWLGFQAEKEKMVAKGAVVDAIWQARIANLGVVTYVFEVQRRGSIDSLILNLQRAQNNPTVQRLVVVANPGEIERIRQEIATMPETFRKSVRFMEVGAAIHAAELIGELSGIIGTLELVRSEFGV